MPCELCNRAGTVSIKPIQDLIQKLKNAKRERKRRENQCTKLYKKRYNIDQMKSESDDIQFR
mgnify:CR=1 FL=1